MCSPEDGPHETFQDPLLECSEADVAASELQALTWDRPLHSCSAQAHEVLKMLLHQKAEWHLLWAVIEVLAGARRAPESRPWLACEA